MADVVQPVYHMCNSSKEKIVRPKPYRAKRPAEVSCFAGAGILPVCRNKGQLYILLWQPMAGKKAPTVRWFDFGGRKKDVTELPLECCVRKFAKMTYGAFGLELNYQSPDIYEDIKLLYSEPHAYPLLLEGAKRWAKSQSMENDEPLPIFFNVLEAYHLMVFPVPYIPADFLDEMSALTDDGKRVFQWITPAEFQKEALVGRVASIKNIKSSMTDLNMNAYFCPEGHYGDFHYHRAVSSISVKEITEPTTPENKEAKKKRRGTRDAQK